MIPLAVAVIGGFIWTGCGDTPVVPAARNTSGNPSASPSANASPKSPQEVASGDQVAAPSALAPGHANRSFDLPLRQETLRYDPVDDGWDTEAFEIAALEQLQALGTLLKRAVVPEPDRLASVLDPEVVTAALRPALEEVFRDASLAVYRPVVALSAASGLEQNDLSRADANVSAALHALLEPFDHDTPLRWSFKVYQMVPKDDGIQTRAYVQVLGGAGGAAVQQSATWLVTWTNADHYQQPLLRRIDVEQFEEVITTAGRTALVSDCTEAVLAGQPAYDRQLVYGVDHWRRRFEYALGPDVSGLEGVAGGDANGDGLDDLYLCQGMGLPNRLFIQQPDGTARDAAGQSGVDWLEASGSALFADLDNDGDQDLIVGAAGSLLVHENDATGRFTLRARVPLAARADSLAAADYDGDRRLDVYVCCHTPSDQQQQESVLGVPVPFHDANNGAPNLLVKNLGNWQFGDATAESGLDRNNRRFSYAAAWEDYDNDGDLDLYVANDFGRNNLYQNDGGHFRDVAAQAGVEDISTGMSVSWADYNQDGRMDLYIGNMFSSAGNRITYQRQFRPGEDATTLGHIRRLARGNSLFENNGRGGFRDASVPAGVTMGRWAWAAPFVDINGDGWEDVVVANGFVTADSADDL